MRCARRRRTSAASSGGSCGCVRSRRSCSTDDPGILAGQRIDEILRGDAPLEARRVTRARRGRNVTLPSINVDDALTRAADAIVHADAGRARVPRQPRRRRARFDARAAPRAPRRRPRLASRPSPSRSSSRRTTASCPASSCSRRPAEFPSEPPVMVTFDSGSLARPRRPRDPTPRRPAELIVIDHHVSNQRYGTINVIDPNAAASGVLVRRLVGAPRAAAHPRRRGVPVRRARVRHRPVPVRVDDTRGVRRSRASSRSFDLPIAPSVPHAVRGAPVRVPPAARRGARRRELVPEKRFVWATVTQSALARHDVTFEEVEGLIDVVRRTREAEVACVLKEASDGSWRVSLRSVGEVDVCSIAEHQGGGGHRFAAGFTSDESPTPSWARSSRRCSGRRAERERTSGPQRARRSTDGLVVVDKPAGLDVARRRRQAAQVLRAAAGRPCGHARSRRDRRLLVGLGPGDALAAIPAGDDEGVPRPNRVRHRDRHARRIRRRARTGVDAADARRRSSRRRARSSASRAGPADGVGDQGRRRTSATRSPGRARRSSGPPRPIRIDAIEVEAFEPGAYPEATVVLDCSSGTYVRSLAADLGVALGGCAHLGELRRLRVGSFDIVGGAPTGDDRR